MNYGTRLKQALAATGKSRKQLGEAMGITVQAIGDVINAKSNAFTAENHARAAAFIGVNPFWLATGDGEMFSLTSPDTPSNALPFNDKKVKEVPVVGKGSGGVMPERLWTDGDYPVGVTGECSDIATSDPHAFLVAVEGPSMIPRYNPGEFALVEPGTAPEVEDDVLVRLATGHTMLKQLRSRRGGWLFGSYNNQEVLHYTTEEVTWVYYVAHPVPRRKIKSRC